jgi:hypothetical protein
MRKLRLWFLLAAAVLMAGCGSSSEEFFFPNNQNQGGPRGFLRFAHLSPDAPNVDIRVNGQVVATNIPFQTVSRYFPFAPGDQRVQIFATGSQTPVIDVDVDVDVNTHQTVAAVGQVANIAPAAYQDTVVNGTNNVLLRTIHAAPDAPAVDLTLADGTVLVSNLSFPNATTYASLAPGQYDLQLRVAGTNQVVRDFPDVDLAAGSVLSAFAVGLLSDQSLDVLVAVDDPNNGSATLDLAESQSSVRLGHLATDAGPVDITIDGQTVATNVTYPTVSGYLQTPTRDSVVVRVFAAGTQNQLLTTTADLDANVAYTVAATGSLADANIGMTTYVDDRVGTGGTAEVRAVHASSDAPAVDVIVDSLTIANGATFPNAGNYTGVTPNNNATVLVNLDINDANVITENGLSFAAGETYSIFVIGRVGGLDLDLLVTQDS